MTELYRCTSCGSVFSEPGVRRWREERSGDGWAWEDCAEYYCPVCYSANLADYDEEDDDEDAGEDSL